MMSKMTCAKGGSGLFKPSLILQQVDSSLFLLCSCHAVRYVSGNGRYAGNAKGIKVFDTLERMALEMEDMLETERKSGFLLYSRATILFMLSAVATDSYE